jgi:4-hydroxy-2-oxoglutarate aldolase
MTSAAALPRSLVAIVTPYTPDDQIDGDAHAHNANRLAHQGCTGFVVAGSTGEGPYLTTAERGDLVRVTRAAQPDSYVMCGVNAESVAQAITQVSAAAKAGADSALVLTPTTLVRGDHRAVEAFYTAVADASPVPLLLYSNPKPTAYELPTESVNTLAAHPNIIGIKDSGGNPARLDDIATTIANGFIVYPGASRALLASHARGAYGAITASANYVFPLVASASSGDAAAQEALDRVIAVVEQHGIPGARAAARANGLIVGDPRPPLRPVEAHIEAAIGVAVANAQEH